MHSRSFDCLQKIKQIDTERNKDRDALLGHFEFFEIWIILDNFGHFGNKCDHFRLFEIIWDHLEPFRAMFRPFQNYPTFSDFVGPL